MTNPSTPRNTPRLLTDPGAVAVRLETLADTPLCDSCATAIRAVAGDTAALLTEAVRLAETLAECRLESANRLAAICAALHADADGEPDPLAYLRDEIAGPDAGWCP